MRLLVVLAIFGFFACSLDYRPAQVSDEASDSVPETVMLNARLVIVRSQARRFHVSAQRVEHFPRQQRQEFEFFEFAEYDAVGTLLSSGSAERATYFTDSDNVEMAGNLSFYSAVQEAGIVAEWLYWNDAERLLTGAPEGLVRVERDGGSVIQGIGFTADMRSSTVEFARQVSGSLVTDDAPVDRDE